MTAREAANRLLREGWSARPGKGSHTIYRKPGHEIVVLPDHRGDIKPGTLRNICVTAGWEYHQNAEGKPPWQRAITSE